MTEIIQAVRDEMDRVALQVAKVVEDHSEIPEDNLESFVSIRREVLDLAAQWGRAWNTAGTIALQLAIRLTRIRYLILKSDGTPDLDGTTHTYSRIVESDIREVLDNLGDDTDGNPILVRDGHRTPIEIFRSRVKQARSDYRVNFAVAAEVLVESDPELAATEVPVVRAVLDPEGAPVIRDGEKLTETVQVKLADIVAANPPGTTSATSTPEVLVAAVDDSFAALVDTKGARKPGFRREDIPPTFGRQPKPKPKPRKPGTGSITGTTGKQDDSTNIVPPDPAMLARWAGNTVLTEVLPVLLRAVSAASDAGIGLPGKSPADPNPVLPDADSRKLAGDLFEQLGTLSWESGKVVARKSGASKGNVQEVRWTDPTADKLAEMLALTQAGETPEPEPTTTEEVLADLTTPEPEPEPVAAAPRRRRK